MWVIANYLDLPSVYMGGASPPSQRKAREIIEMLQSQGVRLVAAADELEEHFIDANERMGEALVKIGMALGLPRPTAQHHWGSPEILARIAEVVPAAHAPDVNGRAALVIHDLLEKISLTGEAISAEEIVEELSQAGVLRTEPM